MEALTFLVAGGTDIGLHRTSNQDEVYAWTSNSLNSAETAFLMVADGMGGSRGGGAASQLAIEAVSGFVVPALQGDLAHRPSVSASDLYQTLEEGIDRANRVICSYAQRNLGSVGSMGTTVVCVLAHGESAVVASVGDSRAYLFRRNILRQITSDHTPVGELVADGLLAPGQVYDHPQRNILTRALGMALEIDVDLGAFHVEAGDRLLLCTDGLWGMVRGKAHLKRVLSRQEDPKSLVGHLIAAAKERGGEDNIGVVVCDVRGASQLDSQGAQQPEDGHPHHDGPHHAPRAPGHNASC